MQQVLYSNRSAIHEIKKNAFARPARCFLLVQQLFTSNRCAEIMYNCFVHMRLLFSYGVATSPLALR